MHRCSCAQYNPGHRCSCAQYNLVHRCSCAQYNLGHGCSCAQYNLVHSCSCAQNNLGHSCSCAQCVLRRNNSLCTPSNDSYLFGNSFNYCMYIHLVINTVYPSTNIVKKVLKFCFHLNLQHSFTALNIHTQYVQGRIKLHCLYILCLYVFYCINGNYFILPVCPVN